jgi:hypothetical protein
MIQKGTDKTELSAYFSGDLGKILFEGRVLKFVQQFDMLRKKKALLTDNVGSATNSRLTLYL